MFIHRLQFPSSGNSCQSGADLKFEGSVTTRGALSIESCGAYVASCSYSPAIAPVHNQTLVITHDFGDFSRTDDALGVHAIISSRRAKPYDAFSYGPQGRGFTVEAD
jgi:hypothetical protein